MRGATVTPFLEAATREGLQLVGFTVKLYDWLIENGTIPEDTSTELIEGYIVRKDRSAVGEDPMRIGNRHRATVMFFAELNSKFKRMGCFIQSQQPIWLPPRSEPEPDLCVVAGTIEDFQQSKPAVGAITSVIKVADSSLKRDLGTKLAVYARGGVREYIVINLVDDVVMVHHNPARGKYPPPKVLRPGEKLKISAAGGKSLEIPLAKLL